MSLDPAPLFIDHACILSRTTNLLQTVLGTINSYIWFKPRNRAAWASMPEIPTPEEILAPQISPDSLPHSSVTVPRASKNELLETTFRILREEGKEGLRFSVNNYRNDVRAGKRDAEIQDDDFTCIYTEASLFSCSNRANINPKSRSA